MLLLLFSSCRELPINSLSNLRTYNAEWHAANLKGKTITVITNEMHNPLDRSLRRILTRHWTFTQLNFIDIKDYEKMPETRRYVMTFLLNSECFKHGKCYQGYAVLKPGVVTGTFHKAEIVSMVPCTPDIEKHQGTLLDSAADLFTLMYVKRLQVQLEQLSLKRKNKVSKGTGITTRFFNDFSKQIGTSKVFVLNSLIKADSARFLAAKLDIPETNMIFVTPTQMKKEIESSKENKTFIFEEQQTPYSEQLGRGYYLYDQNGQPVAATTLMTPEEAREYRLRQKIKRLLIISGEGTGIAGIVNLFIWVLIVTP